MIRYDNKLNKEILRIVNNYNAKIRRLEKKGIDTPKKIYKKDIEKIKTDSNSRKELREVLRDLQEFSKRCSENLREGTNFTNYEYNKVKRLQRKARRNINRQLRFFEENNPYIGGEEQLLTFAQMNDERYINLLSKQKLVNKNFSNMSRSDLRKFIMQLEANSYIVDFIEWQNRYIEIFENTLKTFEIDKRYSDEISKRLKEIDAKKFDKLIRKEQLFKGILDYYAMIKDLDNFMDVSLDVETTVESIINNIDEILEDYV